MKAEEGRSTAAVLGQVRFCSGTFGSTNNALLCSPVLLILHLPFWTLSLPASALPGLQGNEGLQLPAPSSPGFCQWKYQQRMRSLRKPGPGHSSLSGCSPSGRVLLSSLGAENTGPPLYGTSSHPSQVTVLPRRLSGSRAGSGPQQWLSQVTSKSPVGYLN